ncbi:hypothetical protein BGX38DRAFT_1093917, partial [Terfezia claveryi]
WWRTQKTLPIGSSLVPILLTSDQTCLMNFSGDKKLWPLFMSIGNIRAEIRNRPTAQAWILMGLFPIGPKRNKIVSRILLPLTKIFKAGGTNILCGDGKVRKCMPILSTWLADHMENVNIHGIKINRCPVCITSPQELGILPKKALAMHNHADYENLYRAGDLKRYVADEHGYD